MRAYGACLLDGASGGGAAGQLTVDASWLDASGADGGVACGLPRDKALAFAAGMLEGAAALAKASGQHPAILKDAVCSPAGTTIQGVRTLEERGFRGAVMDAVIASYNRTLELK